MPLSLVPFLAQVFTAEVGDRAEVRVINQTTDERMELENRAFASVGFQLPIAAARLTYSPSLLLTPVEKEPRDLTLTHTINASVDTGGPIYRTRRTLVGVHAGATYTQTNVQRQAFGAPATTQLAPAAPAEPAQPAEPTDPGIEPTEPTPADGNGNDANAVRALGLTTRVASARADIALGERLSRRSTLNAYAGYTVSSGVDDATRELFPLLHGPIVGSQFLHAASRRDTLITQVDGQLSIVHENGALAALATATQGLSHQFSRQTSGDVSLGVSYTHVDEPELEPVSGFFPTGRVGLTHESTFARGRASYRLEAAYEPVLDRSTIVFDPRIRLSARAGWTRDRLTLYSTLNGVLTTQPGEEGALNSIGAEAGAAYDLGAGFSVDGGARAAWQSFQGVDLIAPGWALFAGLSWNYQLF